MESINADPEIEKYQDALRLLGLTPVPDLESIACIDRQGFAALPLRDAKEKYTTEHTDYARSFIIASLAQLNAGHSDEKMLSCMDHVLDTVFSKNYDLLRSILKDELVFGKVTIWGKPLGDAGSKLVNVLDIIERHLYRTKQEAATKDQATDAIWSIECELQSSKGTVQTMSRLYQTVNTIKDDPYLLLNNKFMQGLTDEYQKLFCAFGDIRALNPQNTVLSINDPKNFTYKRGNHEYLVISSDHGFFIVYAGLRQVPDVPYFLQMHDTKRILDALYAAKLVGVNRGLGEKNMARIEQEMLVEYKELLKSKDTITDTEMEIERLLAKENLSAVEQYRVLNHARYFMQSRHPEWKDVRDAMYQDASLSSLPSGARVLFTENTSKIPAVDALLARINPLDMYAFQQYDPQGFLEHFNHLDQSSKLQTIVSFNIKIADKSPLNPTVSEYLCKEGWLQ
jgi:hypothetical protein